jgi:hypothetical protein
MTAYDELVAAGLIHGQRGAGMLITRGSLPGVHPLNLRQVMRQAQYPARTLHIADPDGAPLYLSFR